MGKGERGGEGGGEGEGAPKGGLLAPGRRPRIPPEPPHVPLPPPPPHHTLGPSLWARGHENGEGERKRRNKRGDRASDSRVRLTTHTHSCVVRAVPTVIPVSNWGDTSGTHP